MMGVQVNWTEPSTNGAPIIGYRLYMAEEQLSPVLVYDGSQSSRSDVLSHTITGLTIGLNYKFTLQAINPVGQSVLSDPLLVLAALKPLPP